jgi:hypothetical protein
MEMLVNLEYLDEEQQNVVRYIDETVIALVDIEGDDAYEQMMKAITSHVAYLRAKYGRSQVDHCVLFHVVVRSTYLEKMPRFDFEGPDAFLSLIQGLEKQFMTRKEE